MPAHLPTVVIVGRPNVGKSTLFNRLVKKRIAVVQDTPGVTRDRLYAETEHHGRPFQVVDTGGILFSDEDALLEQIRIQADVAIAEADVILFVVDVEEGHSGADWELADHLRGLKKPMFVVANKTDNPTREMDSHEFSALGLGEVMAVSAIHGRGMNELLDLIVDGFPKSKDMPPAEDLRLAIVGRPNVGKSSMLNALHKDDRVIVSNIPGTTRDAIDTMLDWKGKRIRLIDTAGIRRRGKIQGSIEYYMVLRAQRALQRADCALLLVDGIEGLTDGDKRVAKAAHDLGKPLVIAVNKWDEREPPTGNLGMSTPIKKDMIRIIRNETPEVSYAPILFTSALERAGTEGVLKAAFRAVENGSFRIPTGALNRLVQDAAFEKPLSRKGRNFRIYYATQAETNPPTFVLFCNDPDLAHFSYVRYIENQIRAQHPLEGTPIRVVLRARSERNED